LGAENRLGRGRLAHRLDPVRRPPAVTAEDQEQQGHAHGDAVRHLIRDHGPGEVRHIRGYLDAPVHRARVHHQRLGREDPDAAPIQAEQPRVLAHAREELLALALTLDAQHVAHVQLREHAVQIVGHPDAPGGSLRGDQRRRAHERHPRTHLRRRQRERPRDP
jgi:hypothetical protein